ncbi:hypothetical protein [Janthinobacterium sp. B9-8]|uniref:hypothetical protein n=1 Tax=Janthinobacterium sp. B9-8 TaxID=1236179 RepID=UPI0012E3918C|nr:hypothetical protein [Janthinobacterium sp. B9-8]
MPLATSVAHAWPSQPCDGVISTQSSARVQASVVNPVSDRLIASVFMRGGQRRPGMLTKASAQPRI